MLYSAKVMEHFANPHNVGEIPDANGVGEVGNQKCGDIMKMFLKIENGVIEDVKFQTFGKVAVRDLLAEKVSFKQFEETRHGKVEQITRQYKSGRNLI